MKRRLDLCKYPQLSEICWMISTRNPKKDFGTDKRRKKVITWLNNEFQTMSTVQINRYRNLQWARHIEKMKLNKISK